MLKIHPFGSIRCITALLCLHLIVPILYSQSSSEAGLKSRFKKQSLYLRGFYSNDKLSFDEKGQLIGTSIPTSFTLSGFDLRLVNLKKDKLILEGRRVGVKFQKDKQSRIPLNLGSPDSQQDEPMHIEIAASSNGDYGPALDMIFANGLEELAPSLPPYWQTWARTTFPSISTAAAPTPANPKEGSASTSQTPKETPKAPSGSILKSPRLLKGENPDFNEPARRLKYEGKTRIHLQVGSDGTVSKLAIIRPIGLGLDERAVAAVGGYSFSPATKDGQPISVELDVEVSFDIFDKTQFFDHP